MALTFPNINPVIIAAGPLAVSWYSLSYVAGIILAWILASKIVMRFELKNISKKNLEDFISWAIIGIVIGGRLGYVLFYNPLKYLEEPLEIFKTYKGGMSFHGGVVGLSLTAYAFSKRNNINFFTLMDILSLTAPIGLGLGRIANFINGELYGRVTNVPWGMIFPDSDMQVRHPSQLYEAFLEGAALFLILIYALFKYKTINIPSLSSAIFLIVYSIFRMFIELFREPDLHIGFIFSYITMGQLISFFMLLVGLYLLAKIQWR